MTTTFEEFATDLLKYLRIANKEDVLITFEGEPLAILTNPVESTKRERVQIAESLIGVIPADITLEEAREERLRKI